MKLVIDVKDGIDELTIVEKNHSLEVQCSGVECWRCGSSGLMTMHHTIPKHLKPVKNVVVPICEPCHEEINHVDITGIKYFGYKIFKSAKEVSAMITKWTARSETIMSRVHSGELQVKKK